MKIYRRGSGGGKLDAIKYALGANTTNGLRRSNADKRRCVEVALEHWGKMTTKALAEMCGVSRPFVEELRPKQSATVALSETRTGRDGKERHLPAHQSTYRDAETGAELLCAKCGHPKSKHTIGSGECKTILGSGSECACMAYAGPVAPLKVPDGVYTP